MAREWQMYPTFEKVQTPYGFVDLAVTDSDHISVSCEKHGGLTLKSRAYLVSVHVNLIDGEWTPTHVYAADKTTEATKRSFGEHLARFIAEWTDKHPEALVEAGERSRNNDIRSAEEKAEKARAELAEAESELAMLLGGA